MIFTVTFVTLAGLLSQFSQKGIIRGKFPREALHPVYLQRRIYGMMWTQVYYFKPLYAVVLAIPFFKTYVLRLFGYRGDTDFVLYPDTWIRDLPILKVGSGAYLSNKSTIGTNICLTDGSVLVDRVILEQKSLVGHLAMVAPGVKLGPSAEVGVGCAIGIRVRMAEGAKVNPSCTLNHGSIIGSHSEIGTYANVGLRTEVGPGLKVPSGTVLPPGMVFQTQQDVDRIVESQRLDLFNQKESLAQILQRTLEHVS